MFDMYCVSCLCSEECCNCEDPKLFEALFCENCGRIGTEDDMDASHICKDCDD